MQQLSQLLDDDLAWRKRELTTLRFLLEERRRSHQMRVLLRFAVCTLYAHWEGFVKGAADTYVAFVADRGLRYSDLAPNFVALGLGGEIVQAGASNKPAMHTELAVRFMFRMSDTARLSLSRARRFYGEVNLNFESLEDLCCLLGLDVGVYSTKRNLLDRRLVERRNLIAHGRNLEIDLEDYVSLHEQIILLVHHFRTAVENAAVTSSFRAAHV